MGRCDIVSLSLITCTLLCLVKHIIPLLHEPTYFTWSCKTLFHHQRILKMPQNSLTQTCRSFKGSKDPTTCGAILGLSSQDSCILPGTMLKTLRTTSVLLTCFRSLQVFFKCFSISLRSIPSSKIIPTIPRGLLKYSLQLLYTVWEGMEMVQALKMLPESVVVLKVMLKMLPISALMQ